MMRRTSPARRAKPSQTQNNLWFYRKRLGFSQKHIASLLGHTTTSHISDYERGKRLPSLKTVLKLEIILRMPTAGLYHGLYQEVKGEIRQRREKL